MTNAVAMYINAAVIQEDDVNFDSDHDGNSHRNSDNKDILIPYNNMRLLKAAPALRT